MSTVQIKDQTAHSVQSDLDLYFPQRIHVPSSVSKVLVSGIGVSSINPDINPFPNIPFLDLPKFKEAADDNWNVAVTLF